MKEKYPNIEERSMSSGLADTPTICVSTPSPKSPISRVSSVTTTMVRGVVSALRQIGN
jgi:hypothetical protein